MNFADFRSAVVAFLILMASGTPALAQGSGAALIRGQLLDAETHTPVQGAYVALQTEPSGVLSDSLGAFILPASLAEIFPLKVRQLGYHDLLIDITAESAQNPFFLQLYPDPVQIAGLQVLVERFQERRRGPFGAVDVLDQKDLLNSPYGSGAEFIRRVVPFARPCDTQTEELCTNQQGRLEPLMLCVDGQRVTESMVQLEHVDPRALYMVEVYRRGGQVHMYSRGYVERLLASGAELPPLSFGCGQVGLPGSGLIG